VQLKLKLAWLLIGVSAMSRQSREDLSERCFRFTCDVYDYGEDLVRLRGLPCRVAYQLFDAAGSVGANRAEARSAYTNKDFASKNAICLKEAREALFWLRVAEAKALGNVQRRNALMKEANELVSIFVAVIRTLQGRDGSR